MTVSEISDFCCRTIGDTSSDMQDFAKLAIRLKYQTLYDGHDWRETHRVINISLDPNLNGVFFIPADTEELIWLKLSYDGINYRRIPYRERDWIERATDGNVQTPYYRPIYYRMENLAWPYLNPGKLTFTTSDLASFTIHVEGLDQNGNGAAEDFLMLATPGSVVIPGSVQTKTSFSKVLVLSSGSGNVTVFGENPSTLTIKVPAAQSESIYSQFGFWPNPFQTDPNTGLPLPAWVQCEVKLKPDTLGDDNSVPRISHIWDCLIEYTLSSLYTRTRQLQKADAREQKAIAHFQAAINVEKSQSEFRQQAYPTVYDTGSYLDGRHDAWPTSSYPWGWW